MISIKRIFFLVVLLVLCPLMAHSADQRVTLQITLTNLPVTSNTLTFTAPASKTITWTNVAGSANVVTGATIAASATNLYRQLAAYSIGIPRLALGSLTNTNTFILTAEINQNIAVSSAGTAGGNWCSLVLTTNATTNRMD